MTFQVGKFYKAGSKTENFFIGSKLLCIDVDEADVRFYIQEKDSLALEVYWEAQSNCQDFTEWREPREFTLLRNNLGYYEYTPELKLEPGETIKLREVL
jgi:hypothetical protein